MTRSKQFGKSQRLRTPAEFRRVYQSRQYGGSELHTFNVLSNDSAITRLGVTVSKKVSKHAVVRNLVKRQIKEYYRQHQHQLHRVDLVITAKPACRSASTQQQRESLQALWGKVLKWQRWRDSNQPQTSTGQQTQPDGLKKLPADSKK